MSQSTSKERIWHLAYEPITFDKIYDKTIGRGGLNASQSDKTGTSMTFKLERMDIICCN
ncbi:MAG TPA: hypothetical protein VFD60_00965 [Nitrososphaeraceae archaeon]|nr:hypothetical protein [Nitrososphaeraceae archaeon]